MDELLMQRLNILKDAGEISEDIRTSIIDFADNLEREYCLELNEDNAAMLITHLAMALARIKKGEKINEIDELSLTEIKQTPVYNDLPKFFKKIEEKLQLKIPDSEKGFIALHVCTLVSKLSVKEDNND